MENHKKTAAIFFCIFLTSFAVFDVLAASAPFSSSMLVSGEEIRAKIVVGSLNPDLSGSTFDTLSAILINNRVNERHTKVISVPGIVFTYGSDDLDDDKTTEIASAPYEGDDFLETDTSISIKGVRGDDYDGLWIVTELSNFNTTDTPGTGSIIELSENWEIEEDKATNTDEYGIWHNLDSRGDIDKRVDWPVYNDIQIIDRSTNSIIVLPAMRVGNASALLKKVFTLRGRDYYLKEFKPDQDRISLIPVEEHLIVSTDQTQDMIDAALQLPESDFKIGLTGLSTGPSGSFAIIKGGDITSFEQRSPSSDPAFEVGTDLALVEGYYIIPTAIQPSTGTVTLAVGEKSGEIKISHGEQDVLGYLRAVIDEDRDGWGDEFRLEDGEIEISRGKSRRLGPTDTFFRYNSDTEIDILLRKTAEVPSGDTEISQISLPIIKDIEVEASDRSGYNLLLVGGPVSNQLTNELVQRGLSAVDWLSSEGDIEVVDNAFGEDSEAIIVAGKDRVATRRAAEALAAQI